MPRPKSRSKAAAPPPVISPEITEPMPLLMDDPVSEIVTTETPPPASDDAPEPGGVLLCSIPVADPSPGAHCTRHVDLKCTPCQQRGLRMLYDGLKRDGVTLESGREIASQNDAVRWLLEQVASEK